MADGVFALTGSFDRQRRFHFDRQRPGDLLRANILIIIFDKAIDGRTLDYCNWSACNAFKVEPSDVENTFIMSITAPLNIILPVFESDVYLEKVKSGEGVYKNQGSRPHSSFPFRRILSLRVSCGAYLFV